MSKSSTSAEVIIVGAGPAGLALAALLGAQGREVLLVDKSAAPRDKVCGEGLMPLGVAALAACGLDAGSLPGEEFTGLEYRSFRQQTLLDFTPGVRGRGIRRTHLIAALEAAALAHSSVRMVREHVLGLLYENGEDGDGTVRGVRGRSAEYRARVVVAADGVQSRLAHAAGMRVRQYGYRMGLRRHYRLAGGGQWERVRIGLFTPYDVYLTPVGGDVILATTMTTRRGYETIRGDYEGFLRQTPFGEIFGEAQPVSSLLGWHHPLRSYDGGGGGMGGGGQSCHRDMLLLGDAGGSLDPCLGMGISLALSGAGHAAKAVGAMLDHPEQRVAHGMEYSAAIRKTFRHYRAFDYIFRSMVVSRIKSEVLLWGMRHWPETADAVLRAVAEGSPWSNVSLRSIFFPRKRRHAALG